MTSTPFHEMDDSQAQSPITLKVMKNYQQAWKNRDPDAIMDMFHDDIEYHDISLNRIFYKHELHAYIQSCMPKHPNETLTHSDRIRADGHTGFIQYTLQLMGASYRSSEAITVKEQKVYRIHEFGILVNSSNTKSNKVSSSNNRSRLGLSDRQLANLAQDLKQYFEVSQPFLNPELNLQQVANHTGYTRNQISYYLNNMLDKTFYQFVHEMRINYILSNMFTHQPIPSIDELAFSAGFNSLSVFYKHFKQITGYAPKTYIKHHLHSDQ